MPKRAQTRTSLTDRLIADLPLPAAEYWIHDDQAKYLALRVYPNGDRVWYAYGRLVPSSTRKSPIKLQLGIWPRVRVNDARAQIRRITEAAGRGATPKLVRDQLRKQALTYGEAFKEYLAGHLIPFTSTSTVYDAERGLNRYFDELRDKAVADITSFDVQSWLNRVGEEFGKPTANKQFRVFRACLKWCDLHGIVRLHRDPSIGVQTFDEFARERYVKPGDEYTRLQSALEANPSDWSDAIWLLLFTGQRKENVLAMRWEQIDWHAKTWVVPAKNTKSKKSITVPLTMRAMAVLERRAHLQALLIPWVFPCRDDNEKHVGRAGHLVGIAKPWKEILEVAGIKDLHLHDLRHTAGSMMGATGANSFVIQRALGHSTSRMTERYTHLDTMTVLEAMERAQNHLTDAGKEPQEPDPVHFESRRPALRRVK